MKSLALLVLFALAIGGVALLANLPLAGADKAQQEKSKVENAQALALADKGQSEESVAVNDDPSDVGQEETGDADAQADQADDATAKKEAKDKQDLEIEIAGGKFTLTAPDTWERKEPKFAIIEHEFEVPASEGDELAGRVVVMSANGSIEENISRWFNQFVQPDGKKTEDVAETEKITVAGQDVYLIDVKGTYVEPPFAGGGRREGYRMLGAVVKTKKMGNHYIKFYGPEHTVTDHEEAFQQMIESLSLK